MSTPRRPRSPRPLSPNTLKNYKRRLEFLFGPDYTAAIAAEAPINPEVRALSEGMRRTTEAALVRHCAEHLIDPMPFLAQFPPLEYKIKKAKPGFLDEDELSAFETVVRIPRDEFVPRQTTDALAALALLPLAAGLRAAEVLTLSRESVEHAAETGTLLVIRKGGEEQELEHSKAKRLFRDLLVMKISAGAGSRRQWNWQFTGQILSHGSYQTQYQLYHRMIKRFGKIARIKNLHPHALRHAFATRFIRDGGSLATLMVYLNHKDISTTQRYVHMTPKDAQKYLREF